MRRGATLGLLVLAGCKQLLGIDSPVLVGDGGTGAGDGEDDGAIDAGTCFGPPGWTLCFATLPDVGETVVLPLVLDTETYSGCMPAAWPSGSPQPAACMIIADQIRLSEATRVVGSKPLVLLGVASINIASILTVKAGARSVCLASTQPQDSTSGIGGGGAGGSNLSRGGNAGNGATSCSAISTHDTLNGAAAGQAGGSGVNGTGLHATGGSGGGAVYLVSAGTIDISGAIDASGGGGTGGIYNGGGGGGGGGGMIAVYAPTINAIGVLMANGGGGGTHGTNDASTASGQTPSPMAPLMPALGGTFASRSDGGNGCVRGIPATNGSGGAAGGGGCGYILSNGMLSNASVSPGITSF